MVAQDRQRADLWLFQCRFFKTRALASAAIAGGNLRVNGAKVSKSGHGLRAGDVLTFVQAERVRVVRIVTLPTRRGPASEAALHYLDITGGDSVPDESASVEHPYSSDEQSRKAGLSDPAALD